MNHSSQFLRHFGAEVDDPLLELLDPPF